MKTFVLLVPLVLCLAGCEPVKHYNRLNVAAYAGPAKVERKPYGTAQVFQTPADIKQPFTIIGMLSCEGSAGEEAAILNAMLYRACDMGGDGVLLNAPRVGGEDVTPHNSTVNLNLREGLGTAFANNTTGNRRVYRCQVVKLKD